MNPSDSYISFFPASFGSVSNKKRGRFLCDTCGKRFTKPCLVHRHEVVHLSEKPYACSKCDKRFSQSSSLQRHCAEKHKPDGKRYQCEKCPLSFGQKGNLNMHEKKVHPSKAYGASENNVHICKLCESVYNNKQKLSRHINTAHGNDSKHASVVGKSNIVQDDLALTQSVLEQLKTFQMEMQALDNQYMNTTENLKSLIIPASSNPVNTYKCSLQHQNNKTPVTEGQLIDRLSTQETVHCLARTESCSQYVCELCSKDFRKYDAFIRHHRLHTQARPYKCAFCESCFSTNTKLQDHTEIHRLDEHIGVFSKRYPCAVCCQAFSSLRVLDNHTSTHADSYIVKYKCMNCEAIFNSSSKLMSHKHQKSDKEVQYLQQLLPPPVEVQINSNANAADIISTCTIINPKRNSAKFKCITCERLFSNTSALRNHQRVYHGAYSRTCHRIAFKCTYCARIFKTRSNCKVHMLTHLKSLLNVSSAGPLKRDNMLSKPNIVKALVVITDTTSKANIKIVQFNVTSPRQNSAQRRASVRTSPVKTLPQHSCSFCSSKFMKSCDLKRHLVTHTRERLHECPTCGKCFSLSSTLKQHQQTHEMQRQKHICIVCGKKYSAKKSLNVHLRLHTGEQPFPCEYCELKFRTSGQRIAHLKVVHGLKNYLYAEKE